MHELNQLERYNYNPRLTRRGRNTLQARFIELPDSCELLEPEEPVDLRAYGQILHKRLSTILIVFFVAFTVIAIATLKQKPTYRAQVMLEIQKENPDIPTIQELYELESVSDTYLRTQYSMLASESLGRRVINQLHLDALPEFNAPNWWSWQRKKSPSDQTFAFRSTPPDRDRDAYQRVLENFQHRLTIDAVNHSRLVAVKFDSHDPDLAARVANALAADYIEQNLEARWKATQKAAEWLSQQLLGVKGKLERSEDELQAYARNNNLIFIQSDKGASQSFADERLHQLQEELTRVQADLYSKEALYRLVQAGDYGSLPGVFENRMLQDLTLRLTELKREHAQLSTTFSPDYPRVKEVQNQINEIEASLQEERKRAADQIANEYFAAASRERLVRQALADQQKQINLVSEKSVQYNILKREVDTNKQLYEGLLQRLKDAGLSASLKASNIRIVDPAEPPTEPVKPEIPLDLALGSVLGLVLGVSAAFLQERLDDTLKGVHDVERLFGLPALALIPAVERLNGEPQGVHKLLEHTKALHLGENANGRKADASWYRIDMHGPQHAALVEAFRSLRTSILLSTADHPPSSLLVTSTQPGEGKTTIAANLAIALSQLGHRVLLVDADLRSPSLHRLFGMRETLGLVSYLAGHHDWHGLVRPSESPTLDLLLCGPLPPNPSELLSSRRMGTLIQAAQKQYEFVILDSAPMLALADSRILAPLLSGVLFVVKDGNTPREQVQRAQSAICSVGANLIGMVLNNVDLRTNGYYHYGLNSPDGRIPLEKVSFDGASEDALSQREANS